MPLFKARATQTLPASDNKIANEGNENHCQQNGNEKEQDSKETGKTGKNATEPQDQPRSSKISRSPLVFHCQLAHGSPTGLVSGFSNVRELYQKIAECYEIPVEDILFCTLNTHKIDMTELLGSRIGVGDFIFAHKKGRPKEIELVKSDDALGLTITDNGAGYAFIKRIKEGSVIDRIKVIEVGDHIEKIDSNSLVGKRHFEVAKTLKDIPKGSSFVLRLVEPLKNGFGSIGPRGDIKKGKKSGYGSGRETLRFKAGSGAQIEVVDDVETIGINKISVLIEDYIGIHDTSLAADIWEMAEGRRNSSDFVEAIYNSYLEGFEFSEDLLMDFWGAVTDARAGRHR